MSNSEEFEVKATGPDMPVRIWTRDKLDPCKFIAERAVTDLGYKHAEVVNTFGGHRSDPLYSVGEK
jgi:hypothetical protein